jgi:hypothetical protein
LLPLDGVVDISGMPRLSRNDIREAAVRFAHRWHEESRERGEAQSFWTEFLAVFGNERRRVNAAFERHARRTSTGGMGYIDLLWPKMLLAEHKSRGASLDLAMEQALDYVDGLGDEELPRLIIVSDFERMRILDLEAPLREPYEFELLDLPHEIDRLLVLAGYERRSLDEEPKADIEAAELLGTLYEEIEATGYPEHSLGAFMVRILFLLFADDTNLWARDQFRNLVRNRTSADGADLGMWIGRLFTVLKTDEAQRTTILDEDLAAFPRVGGLFREPIEPPDTNRSMRERLLEAADFDWSSISPAIFGSIFQSVMDKTRRRSLGTHYTSERNILKLIEPLFLDALRQELEECGNSQRRLAAFHQRLGGLKFLDPACGCGNFLVVAYRELRALERETLLRLHPTDVQLTTELASWRKVSFEQFLGIEIEEFPAQIAETAMYLVDHLENEILSRKFGVSIPELPLETGTEIRVGNALQIPWGEVLHPAECDFLLGNPPYAGKHLLNQEQKEDLGAVLGERGGGSSVDYVACWFVRAAEYLNQNNGVRGAFVATNSITQGEQVPRLWPLLHAEQLHITFAWRTFNWTSEGRRAAHVHVVIVGFGHFSEPPRASLFEYDAKADLEFVQPVSALNGYLVAGAEVYPEARSAPVSAAIPRVVYGAKPADGGGLLLSAPEAEEVAARDPIAGRYIRPLMSATEFLNGEERFCLWLVDANPADLRASPQLRARLAAVREFRERSTKQKTREMAALPGLFAEVRCPSGDFVFVPRHASASRRIIPMGFVAGELEAIVHDSGAYIEEANLTHFGLLQSEMFGAWQRTVGGRIKSDYRFNNRLVYNTFPFPSLSSSQETGIAAAAQSVLDARAAYPTASLADLYSPLGGSADLLEAHRQLDRRVDAAFGRRKPPNEAERLEILFARYAETLAVQMA